MGRAAAALLQRAAAARNLELAEGVQVRYKWWGEGVEGSFHGVVREEGGRGAGLRVQ